ncbi:transcriptional regulator with XRE-family HTH domain [Streptomyces sp. T12]|uniref:helix-turn-helix transcriptional regulator n=1 Tax=Streptomyces sp. T12 TaxID=477697 RepID=UPI0011A503EA|nr:helix-turn-helix transcriptional regulator [Streptomyces sp. T12]TWD17623.1 transcriptional regulator with XRE-family HTH domain [Streptomyces sp. T12]
MTQLGDYLRACRARISPEDVGLPAFGRRRVPGLRREELASLAGVSVDYVVRLEQGRMTSASPTILLSLAEALRLGQDEKEYLLRIAAEDSVAARTIRPTAPRRQQQVSSATQALLAGLAHVPALLLGRRMDILAWNQLGAALFTDFAELPPGQRNHIWLTFLDPQVRGMYDDWVKVARECVAYLRMDAARYPDDPELARLVGELSLRDNDFSSWWADHRVRAQRHGRKRFHHPVAGELDLNFQVLDVRGETDQSLLVYTAEPGSSSADGLAFLTSWVSAQGSVPVSRGSNNKEN